jgi:hypothetical protein
MAWLAQVLFLQLQVQEFFMRLAVSLLIKLHQLMELAGQVERGMVVRVGHLIRNLVQAQEALAS